MILNELTHDAGFLSMILNENNNMVFVKDNEYRIIFANKAYLDLYHPDDRDKVIGSTTFENFPPEEFEGFVKEDRQALDGGTTEIIENVTDYKGVEHTFITKKKGFKSKDGQPLMLGIATNVDRMAEQERKLVEQNTFLDKFLSIAAHDLRSPLNTLVSCIDIIGLDKQTNMSEDSQGIFTSMRQCIITLMGQVATLVDMNNESNMFSKNETDLNSAFSEILFNLSSLVDRNDIKILSNVLPTMNIDKTHFIQIVQNLIENSIKYRTNKSLYITVKAFEESDRYRFEIEDNGKGINPDSNIFQLFAQQNPAYQGEGIGLTICKRLLNIYNSPIWVDTTYQDGARICFTLPKETKIELEDTRNAVLSNNK